jgi:hypothetical protein
MIKRGSEMEIDNFLKGLHRGPDLCVRLAALFEAFRRGLPPGGCWQWSRSRFISELKSRGYLVGPRRRVAHVAGLSLDDRPTRAWQLDKHGSLRLRPVVAKPPDPTAA